MIDIYLSDRLIDRCKVTMGSFGLPDEVDKIDTIDHEASVVITRLRCKSLPFPLHVCNSCRQNEVNDCDLIGE